MSEPRGRVAGKVAFITGAARGQGRSHAIRLAEEGADVVLTDACVDIPTTIYNMASEEELRGTAAAVEVLGRKVIARKADVRVQSELDAVVGEALDQFGHIDIVAANAGVVSNAPMWELSEVEWQNVIDIDLTGCWHTLKATVPSMIEAGRGGSIILTTSCAGLEGVPNLAHYTAAKHGVVGLMRAAANELGPHRIRVNAIAPGTTNTMMAFNEPSLALFRPDLEDATFEDMKPPMQSLNLIPEPCLEPIDISNGVLWLGSDEARFVTGIVLSIDLGWIAKSCTTFRAATALAVSSV
jgi:SDR family mycofactocin-dependent oxidoreductase